MVPEHFSQPPKPIDNGAEKAVDPHGFATCPTCHAVDPTMTNAALAVGGDWRCQRCGQRWDSKRIATVAAYQAWDRNRRESERPSAAIRGLA